MRTRACEAPSRKPRLSGRRHGVLPEGRSREYSTCGCGPLDLTSGARRCNDPGSPPFLVFGAVRWAKQHLSCPPPAAGCRDIRDTSGTDRLPHRQTGPSPRQCFQDDLKSFSRVAGSGVPMAVIGPSFHGYTAARLGCGRVRRRRARGDPMSHREDRCAKLVNRSEG